MIFGGLELAVALGVYSAFETTRKKGAAKKRDREAAERAKKARADSERRKREQEVAQRRAAHAAAAKRFQELPRQYFGIDELEITRCNKNLARAQDDCARRGATEDKAAFAKAWRDRSHAIEAAHEASLARKRESAFATPGAVLAAEAELAALAACCSDLNDANIKRFFAAAAVSEASLFTARASAAAAAGAAPAAATAIVVAAKPTIAEKLVSGGSINAAARCILEIPKVVGLVGSSEPAAAAKMAQVPQREKKESLQGWAFVMKLIVAPFALGTSNELW